ncbi:unnamed protein product [Ectocarpus sp. 6 AP-2014]
MAGISRVWLVGCGCGSGDGLQLSCTVLLLGDFLFTSPPCDTRKGHHFSVPIDVVVFTFFFETSWYCRLVELFPCSHPIVDNIGTYSTSVATLFFPSCHALHPSISRQTTTDSVCIHTHVVDIPKG